MPPSKEDYVWRCGQFRIGRRLAPRLYKSLEALYRIKEPFYVCPDDMLFAHSNENITTDFLGTGKGSTQLGSSKVKAECKPRGPDFSELHQAEQLEWLGRPHKRLSSDDGINLKRSQFGAECCRYSQLSCFGHFGEYVLLADQLYEHRGTSIRVAC